MIKQIKQHGQELQKDWGGDITGYEKLFKSADEIEKDIKEIKNTLWAYSTDNAEQLKDTSTVLFLLQKKSSKMKTFFI